MTMALLGMIGSGCALIGAAITIAVIISEIRGR